MNLERIGKDYVERFEVVRWPAPRKKGERRIELFRPCQLIDRRWPVLTCPSGEQDCSVTRGSQPIRGEACLGAAVPVRSHVARSPQPGSMCSFHRAVDHRLDAFISVHRYCTSLSLTLLAQRATSVDD